MHRDGLRVVAELREGLPVELGERGEPGGAPADDREDERESVLRGAHDRFGASAHPDPGAQRPVLDLREHLLAGERRSEGPSQVTGSCGSSAENRASFSSNSSWY
ncbi:hypothetical protein GCM10025870_28200 [Agromyces marinus]|uniref:Uncharacterized protein n=1 Tax=Agromyces marinus TaxID=1389020 RepID=A0ABM8H4L4_9MICO|nr:hypothetical protein GCM10025870_28200 [Agromyces marinus]